MDDALHATHVRLKVAQRLLDRRAEAQEQGPGATDRVRETRFRITGELAESAQGGPEGPSRRLERDAEILRCEDLGLPRSRMPFDEGIVERRGGLSEIGRDTPARLNKFLARLTTAAQCMVPRLAHPAEQVDGINMLRRHPEDEAVRLSPEDHLAKEPRRVRKLARSKASEDVGLPISRIEKLVR